MTWSEVPKRIMQRYAENAEYLVKFISSLFKQENVAAISNVQDTYGFKKTLILLTEPGKLFALQSNDATVKWTYFNPMQKIIKVFVEQQAGLDGKLSIVVVSQNYLIHLDPVTGTQQSIQTHNLEVSDY